MCGMAVYSAGCERGRGGAAKVPKRRKKNEITVLKTRCLLIARFAISSRSANAAILLLANYYFIGHFIGHRCIGIINMRGSKLFHNV